MFNTLFYKTGFSDYQMFIQQYRKPFLHGIKIRKLNQI